MSQKTAKTKKKNHIRSPITPKPWPNLPGLNLLRRQPSRMRTITSFCGVTKTWRSPSRKCSPIGKSRLPQLVEINGKQKNIRTPFLEILFIDQDPYPYYKRRSYGCYWYPVTHVHGQTVVMMLTGSCSPAFAYYRFGKWTDREWILVNCTIKEPYAPGINMRFCNGIGFQGKVYGLSLQGTVVVIENVDSHFRITRIGRNRAVPRKVSRQFREYLVELDGEILLIFLVSRKSIGSVDDVEVFRLDIPRLLWVELGSIGDRALFLKDQYCKRVIASEVGCVKNCVYFSHDRSDEWWVFDMENGKIAWAFGSDVDVKECGT